MKNGIATLFTLLAGGALLAAPKLEPVAGGYPNWQGLSAKSFIAGRKIQPSDLRHKATIVVEVDAGEKVQSQLTQAAPLIALTGIGRPPGFGDKWETLVLPRSAIAVVSVYGAKNPAAFLELLKRKTDDLVVKQAIQMATGQGCSIYEGLTFPGAPETAGKRPYVYVMGPEGTEPAFKGELNAANVKAATEIVQKLKKQVQAAGWEPFYGSVKEPKFFPQLTQAIEKGKTAKQAPLASVEKAIQKEIASKDPEKAKEAQILYDALVQTRSDLAMRIKMESGSCPHRAIYDMQRLLKYWPAEKKGLEAAVAKVKAMPDAEVLGKVFCRIMELDDPSFVCKSAADAKKIVAELNKAKKAIGKLKESKNIRVQDGALTIDVKLDELISSIPTKVPVK